MAGFSVTPAAILRRFALNKTPKVVACTEQLAHIFEEMYRVPEKARISYFQIKILELLARARQHDAAERKRGASVLL